MNLDQLMTPDPETLPSTASVLDAATTMADKEIGDVVVQDADSGTVCGLLTDRDVVVRVVAQGLDPATTTVGEVCTRELVTLSPQDTAEQAAELMRTHAVRRLPVVDGGAVVGIVSLGDLAQERDPESVLADISAAPPQE